MNVRSSRSPRRTLGKEYAGNVEISAGSLRERIRSIYPSASRLKQRAEILLSCLSVSPLWQDWCTYRCGRWSHNWFHLRKLFNHEVRSPPGWSSFPQNDPSWITRYFPVISPLTPFHPTPEFPKPFQEAPILKESALNKCSFWCPSSLGSESHRWTWFR